MSLTQLLNISEVKQALAENFRRPAFPQVTPNLVAPSQAQDPSLAGIAFDYLFRSEIYDRLRLNSRKYFGRSIDADWFGVLPITTPSELDSKHSLRVIDFVPIAGFGLRMLNNSAAVSDALKNQANAVYDTVTQAEIRNSYASDEKLTLWERTENYLRLAKFDQVYRAGYVHDDFEKIIKTIQKMCSKFSRM